MSRHRNMRQMVDDDDYYDDDDGYYDDYDDYPQPKAPAKKKPGAAAAAGKAAAANNNNNKEQVLAGKKKKNVVASSIAAAAPVVHKLAAAEIVKPPPGLSVIAPPQNKPQQYHSSTTTDPINKPPTKESFKSSMTLQRSSAVPKILTQPSSEKEKERLTVVVLGHVDAGKSTVTGHLLYYNNQRQQQQQSGSSNHHRKGSSLTATTNFAWLLDENPQERAHGITMDIATKTLATTRYQVVLLDAPGHADHVPAMITGTAQADAALLVVDVTDATSNSPSGGGGSHSSSHKANTALDAGQLKEHVYLARGLGVQQLLVVVNKMDMVDWSRESYERVCATLTPFLTQVGFGAGKLRFLPVSGLTGTNVYGKTTDAVNSKKEDQPYDTRWYQGPTLMQALDEFDPPSTSSNASAAALERPLRIVVTDVVGEQGKGVAVRGKIVQGWIKTGDALVVLPLGEATTVQKLSSLQPSHDAERNKFAVAGEVIDCTLQNIDIMRVATGNILTRPNERPSLAIKCRAKVWILEGLAIPIIRGAQALFHMHHLDIPCHMSMLIQTLKKDGSVLKERPRALTANTQAIVELTLSVPIVMEAFNDCRAMGRFVLRRSGQSIAVGRIEEVLQ